MSDDGERQLLFGYRFNLLELEESGDNVAQSQNACAMRKWQVSGFQGVCTCVDVHRSLLSKTIESPDNHFHPESNQSRQEGGLCSVVVCRT